MSTERFTRIIAHADMDAFYAAIEQLDFPELRGKPVLVGGPGQRGVVATASYEARPFGVGSAMSMARARRLCPQAIVVPPRFERYSEMSRRIMAVFGTFSVRVQPLSLDEAFLDMSGAEHLFGPPAEMGRAIKGAVAEATGGLTVSIGFANTKFLAKVASDHDKPDGLTVVPPEAVRAFLDPLPVSKLWGVGPKTRERLVRLGLRTIRDVFRADVAWLERRLGSLGRHIWRLAHNQDPRDVTTGRRAKSVSSERTLARDITGAEAIKPHLLKAADRVAGHLRRKHLLANGVRVKLKTDDFQLHSRQGRLAAPSDHADTLYAAALELLPRFEIGRPVRLVGLGAFDLMAEKLPRQGDLFEADHTDHERRLDETLDAIAERFGSGVVKRGTDV